MEEDNGVLAEEARDDKDGLDDFPGITRLVPQKDLGATTRTSVCLSSLSPAALNSEDALADVVKDLVDGLEFVWAAGEESGRASLEYEGPRRKGTLANGVLLCSSEVEGPLREVRLLSA